jgi:hypothetical protein
MLRLLRVALQGAVLGLFAALRLVLQARQVSQASAAPHIAMMSAPAAQICCGGSSNLPVQRGL